MKSVILSCAGALSFAVTVAVHRPWALEFPAIIILILSSFQIGLLIWCVCNLIKDHRQDSKIEKMLIAEIGRLDKEIAEIENEIEEKQKKQRFIQKLESTYNQS